MLFLIHAQLEKEATVFPRASLHICAIYIQNNQHSTNNKQPSLVLHLDHHNLDPQLVYNMAKKRITQETFDAAVKDNQETFDMSVRVLLAAS